MSEYKQQYKNPRLGFGNIGERRVINAYKQNELRKEARIRAFGENRKLQDGSIPNSLQHADIPTIKDERMKKLIKWKEERDKKKKLTNTKKKPAFKVGVVHHSLYSPISKIYPKVMIEPLKSPPQVRHSNDVQKRVTRATEKRLLAKKASKQETISTKQETVSKSSVKHHTNARSPTSDTKTQTSFAPVNHAFRPPSGLMPLFGLVTMEQTPSEKEKSLMKHTLKESKAHDTNNQENILSQKLNTQIPDLNNIESSKNRKSPRLSSNKETSQQRLHESVYESNNIHELSKIITKRLSLDEQKLQSSLQDNNSSSNTSTKALLQKTPLNNNTPLQKENCDEDLIIFSPYLTLSRGKSNARKEQQLRLGIGRSSSGEIPTKDTVMKNLNISVEEEERTAQYFKFLLNKETDRLKELCKKWSNIQLEKDIPEDAKYEINQAVGQTNLLINKKFERFRGLVSDCETGKGEMLVTCRDLQGFWDMTYMEVKDCNIRFEKLEQRHNTGWKEEQHTVIKPIGTKRMPVKKKIAPSKPSSLRSLISAARKQKMAETSNNLSQKDVSKGRITSPPSNRKSVAFKENTNIRKSNDRCKSPPTRPNSSRTSLLQKVQFSTTSKNMKSPFAIMKISRMCKTPEVQLDDTISYVNSDQTPGKSILKKSEEVINKEVRVKSAHKVNFDSKIVLSKIPVDEETQTKLNLAAALNKIDSFDLDTPNSEEECFDTKIERRLSFENEDSDNTDEWLLKIPMQLKEKQKESTLELSVQNSMDPNTDLANDVTSMSFKELSGNSQLKMKSSRKSLRIQAQCSNATSNNIQDIPIINIFPVTPADNISFVSEINPDIEEHDSEIRVLRNRIITTNDTPRKSRGSKIMTPKKENISKKENKNPVKKGKSSLKLSEKEKKNVPLSGNDMIETNENIFEKRKSTRKSIAFNAESCLACAESKPMPMTSTPYSKRQSKLPRKQNREKHLDEDLMSWETTQRKF